MKGLGTDYSGSLEIILFNLFQHRLLRALIHAQVFNRIQRIDVSL
jgi:hypothetical protein